MTRLLHICLLLTALLGLAAQSTAMAMVPVPLSSGSVAQMDCVKMGGMPASDKRPCKQMTIQCIAAMGCSPVALVAFAPLSVERQAIVRQEPTLQLAARLSSRSFGPEPEPPAILI